MSDCTNIIRKMDYYIDRSIQVDFLEIANECTEGNLFLWDIHYLDTGGQKGNIFNFQFETEAILKKEYLFAMDYLSYVLTAYQKTGKEIYRQTFEKIICEFHEYLKEQPPFYSELPVYAQTLLFIKALDILEKIPWQEDFLKLLLQYADWLMDDNNHHFNHNHGLFEDLALLHISILFQEKPEAKAWQERAIQRIEKLFDTAYYSDFTNNENSIRYFELNNYLYEQIVGFCSYYQIADMCKLKKRLEKSKEILNIFAHKDTSFPLIGDGQVFHGQKSNQCSQLFPDIGIAIVKVEEVYVSFKEKTVLQSHAHTDVSSMTARYQDIDFIMDSGQYNYDRYSPVNRFLRSSAGHSGIFPVFADGMFLGEFCEAMKKSEITEFEHQGSSARVKGEYQLKDARVCREISVFSNEILVRDSWTCEKPTVMRQRWIIPKELLPYSRFTVSKQTLESRAGNVRFKYEILSETEQALTTVNFGVAAPHYNDCETTMLLDTITENTLSGEIIAKISFWEEEV